MFSVVIIMLATLAITFEIYEVWLWLVLLFFLTAIAISNSIGLQGSSEGLAVTSTILAGIYAIVLAFACAKYLWRDAKRAEHYARQLREHAASRLAQLHSDKREDR